MGNRNNSLSLLLLTILAFIVNGCAVAPPATQTQPAEQSLLLKAQGELDRGNLEAAAQTYLLLADQGSLLKQPEYELQAASLYIQANRVAQAERIVDQIDPGKLHERQLIRRQLLAARIALINHRTGDALTALEVNQPPTLPDEQRAELYQLRAEAYNRRRNPLKAAQNYVIANNYIADPTERLNIQHTIWQLLSEIPAQGLNNLKSAPAPDELTGWLELIRIAKDSKNAPIDIATRLRQWRINFPAHQADQAILDGLLARQGKVIEFPQHIALLLPFTGTYQNAAAVIRDGFMSAYYANTNKHNEEFRISVYDTTRFNTIDQAYQQAVIDGASFIVGPLVKDDVTRLSNHQPLSVPVLTLNYGDIDKPAPGFFQFGLSPEQEAQQVAERAWLDGNNRALALTPSSDWGERVYHAFAEHWEKLGGILLKQDAYPSDNNDFAVPIQDLLELNESKERHRNLQSILKQTLHFEPRRRQDADFVFMAAFPRQARLLRPQLKFHYASNLPVYSTSHVFTGKRDRYTDRDMDDIQFCDMPWTLDSTPVALKRQLLKTWPEQMRNYSRLFALGIDAYELIPQIEYLQMFRHERVNGMTGTLYINEDQRVARSLKWAQFEKGLPVLLQ